MKAEVAALAKTVTSLPGDPHVKELLVEQMVERLLGATEIVYLNRLARELLAFRSFAQLVLYTVPGMTWRPVLVASRSASERNKAEHMDLADAYDLVQTHLGDPRRARRRLLNTESALPTSKVPMERWARIEHGSGQAGGRAGERGGAR